MPASLAPRRFSARGPRQVLAVDAVLGLVLAWAGWLAGHVTWDHTRGPGGEGRTGEGPMGPMGPWSRRDAGVEVVAASPWLAPALVLVALGVALRRLRPRTAFVVAVAGVGLGLATGSTPGPVLLAPALVVVAMATRLPLRAWAPFMVLLVPMVWAGWIGQPYLGLLDPGLYASLLSVLAVTVMPALFVLVRRTRREDDERQREAERHRYAYEERLRIAREVHDVVGHSLSVVTMQAGVALHLLDKQRAAGPAPSPEVTDALEAIRRTSREALAELRTTLGVFREPTGGEPRAPRPGLARLDDLVAALRQAGRRIEVVRDPGPGAPVPAAVDQAAFRIIQEGLTNVVRHAGDATATVSVHQDGQRLRVDVADDGPAGAVVEEGNGIRGMRERARAVGGTVSLVPRPTGGLLLSAELPLAAADRTSEPAR